MFVFLVVLMVIVVIGILLGICKIDNIEFYLLIEFDDLIGMLIMGSGDKEVIMFGRCVVLLVLVMIMWISWL